MDSQAKIQANLAVAALVLAFIVLLSGFHFTVAAADSKNKVSSVIEDSSSHYKEAIALQQKALKGERIRLYNRAAIVFVPLAWFSIRFFVWCFYRLSSMTIRKWKE